MQVTEFKPGLFCWAELGTSDDAAAREFYTKFFGWKTDTHPMGESEGDYTMLRLGDAEVGGLYKLFPQMVEQGVPPNWLSYVGVADVDATTARAKELGANVLQDALDVMDIGRMSVIQDPTGAVFALWQAKTHTGCGVVAEPGATCWNELMTPDTAKAGEFYSKLFGWELQEQQMGPIAYTMFMHAGQPAGGMMSPPPEAGEVPPNWMVYFAVGDCDEQVQLAESLGASVCAPPSDVPGVGRMAVISDPQGAVFAIIRLQEGAA